MVNISSQTLSPICIQVLAKGLSFCPNPHMDWFQLELDLHQFFRRLKLRVWFNDKTPTVQTEIVNRPVLCLKDFDLNVKSDFSPNVNNSSIDAFIDLVKADIDLLRKHSQQLPFKYPNMTHAEIAAVNTLSHDHSLTIKPADKGGGIVVMDTTDYVTEAMRQLNDCEVYRLLPGDPKWDFERKIKTIISEAVETGLIDKKLSDFLIVKNPITPALYLLPKIHKTLDKPPGRPIVSGRGSIFNHISIFLDKILRIHATSAKSFIRDCGFFG